MSAQLLRGEEFNANLDAFNDMLRGGFGTPPGGFVLRWVNSARSRAGHARDYSQPRGGRLVTDTSETVVGALWTRNTAPASFTMTISLPFAILCTSLLS